MGGGLDVNLFPQRPDLNRGRSSAGKTYRKMEAYAAQYPGTFTFSRVLYMNEAWVPADGSAASGTDNTAIGAVAGLVCA
jgi:hypothetical protein